MRVLLRCMRRKGGRAGVAARPRSRLAPVAHTQRPPALLPLPPSLASSPHLLYARELLHLPDGGCVALDEEELPDSQVGG